MLKPESPITILSVSPCAEDHDALAEILRPYEWTIHCASTLLAATLLLRSHPINLVVCERDLWPHSWKDLLIETAALPAGPFLVVTSGHADDRLWAEVLNLGAYDVLVRPFDAAEVRCSLKIAVLHWQWNREPALPRLVRTAGASRTQKRTSTTAC